VKASDGGLATAVVFGYGSGYGDVDGYGSGYGYGDGSGSGDMAKAGFSEGII